MLDEPQADLQVSEEIPAFGLRHALELAHSSSQAMAVLWGGEFIVHFNDACRDVIGDGHSMVAGRPAPVAWTELWQAAAHRVELASRGEASTMTALRLEASRAGRRDQSRYDVAFSPLAGEAAITAGVLCTFTESAANP